LVLVVFVYDEILTIVNRLQGHFLITITLMMIRTRLALKTTDRLIISLTLPKQWKMSSGRYRF